jgi:MFS family permease
LNSLIRERFSYDIISAGQAIAGPSFIIACLAPLFGIISDKHGHRGDILIVATLLLATSQIWMASIPACRECPDIIYAIFLFQIAYSFFITNIWAALRLITPKHLRGVGVGITNSL